MDELAMPPRHARLLFLVLLAAILVLSLVPEERTEGSGLLSLDSNWAHVPAYLLLTLAAVVARIGGEGRRGAVRAAIFTSAVGVAIEIIQPSLGRSMSVGDALLNEAGVGLALGLAWRKVQ